MEMLDHATIEKLNSSALGATHHNHGSGTGAGGPNQPSNKYYKKFQLPQLNLNLNQSMQFDMPPNALINQSQSVLNS